MRARGLRAALECLALASLALLAASCTEPGPHEWSDDERLRIARLSIDSLPPLPPSPSNAVADDPAAARLGHRLFFDERLSANGSVSCATCHQPPRHFTDALPRSVGMGTTKRHAPSIVGAAWQEWMFWDGRRDSLWAQALTPLEDLGEHGTTRTELVRALARHHAADYEAVFGPLPDTSDLPASAGPFGDAAERAAWEALDPAQRREINRAFANLGKAIAAYERRIRPGRTPFDRYAAAVTAGEAGRLPELFDDAEARGLRLFLDSNCTDCHDGPLLGGHDFQNIGLPVGDGVRFDAGRSEGVLAALADPFNCLGEFSDADPDECEELQFIKHEGPELLGAMKVPSLRNVAETAPYMHAGQLATLRDVLRHYDEAPEPAMGHSDLLPLELDERDFEDLEAFLRTLSAPPDVEPSLLEPPP